MDLKDIVYRIMMKELVIVNVINFYLFYYILNLKKMCLILEMYLLILVKFVVNYIKNCEVIWKIWGRIFDFGIKFIFLVGFFIINSVIVVENVDYIDIV